MIRCDRLWPALISRWRRRRSIMRLLQTGSWYVKVQLCSEQNMLDKARPPRGRKLFSCYFHAPTNPAWCAIITKTREYLFSLFVYGESRLKYTGAVGRGVEMTPPRPAKGAHGGDVAGAADADLGQVHRRPALRSVQPCP